MSEDDTTISGSTPLEDPAEDHDDAIGPTGNGPTAPTSTAPAPPPPSPPSPPWSGGAKRVFGVAFVIAALVVLYLSRNVLSLAALAGLIAFLISPIIRFMHHRLHVPRALALLISYIVVFVSLLVVGLLMADGVMGAVGEIDVTEAETSLRSTAQDVLESIREFSIAGYTVDLSETVDPMLDSVKEAKPASTGTDAGGKTFSLSQEQVTTLFGGLTSGVRTLGGALMAAFMSGVITVLVALYLNADSSKFLAGMRTAVPEGYEGDADELAGRTMHIWKGYLYGQMFNSATVGLMMWLVLWAIGLPGAFVFALILAVLNMIPTFGPILAAVPAVLAALALGSDRLDWGRLSFAILIAVLYIVVVQLHANILAPFITGRAVKLSPATVMIGLLVGVHVGGLVGALLVVPVVATGKEFFRYGWAKLTGRNPFPESAGGPVPAGDPDPQAPVVNTDR